MAVRLVMTQDSKRALAEMDRYNKKWKETKEGVKETTQETQKWDRMARQVVRKNETDQERYNRQLKETVDLYKRNRISLQTARREVARLDDEYKRLNKSFLGSFGSSALGKVRGMIGGFTDIMNLTRSAVAFATEFQQKIRAASEAARASQRGPRAELAQLPQDDAARVAAERFARSALVGRDVAIAGAQAAGARGNLDLIRPGGGIARITATGDLQNTADAVNALATLALAFKKGVGKDPERTLAGATKAAIESPFSVNAILREAADPAAFAKETGTGFADTLAALATVAVTSKDPERARVRTQAFFKSMLGAGRRGSVTELIAQTQRAGGIDTIGESRAQLGFAALRDNPDIFGRILENIEAGIRDPGAAFTAIEQRTASDPAQRSINFRRRRELELQFAEEDRGILDRVDEAVLDEILTVSAERGDLPIHAGPRAFGARQVRRAVGLVAGEGAFAELFGSEEAINALEDIRNSLKEKSVVQPAGSSRAE